MNKKYRTHLCEELDITDVGKEISVSGWVHRRRDHGGVIFIDLRDVSGILQLVFNPEYEALFETAEKITLLELGIGKKSGAKILAIKEDEKLITNPGGDFLLQPGQVLIAFGSKEQLTTLNRLLGNLVVSVELLK